MTKKNKYDDLGLNALDIARNTIDDSINNPTTLQVDPPQPPATPASENVAIETQPTSPVQPQSVEASENVASAAPAAVERKPRRQKKTAARPSAEEEAEKTKLISVQVPMSLYRRLSAMKMDTDISLKDLSLQAIEELVKRNGY